MQLDDLLVVVKVAEFRSITAAATHLDLQVATASAAVKRVEAKLGVELFVRTTRQLRLSTAGERYLPQCQAALGLLDQAKQSIYQESDTIRGEVRIAVSSDLGRNLALPWIDDFIAQHPEMTLRAHISDSNIDFYRDALDMALRYGAPADANVYGFKICDVPRFLVASPEYLQTYGAPTQPSDIAQHRGLFYQLQDILNDTWAFTDQDKRVIKVKPQASRSANDGDMVRRWCVAGKGLAVKSGLDVAEDILAGRLIPLMPDYQVEQGELWLICPSRQSITPAVRLLRDGLRVACADVLKRLSEQGFLSLNH